MLAPCALRGFLLVLFSLVAVACQPERAFLVVTVNGLSAQVQTLEVRAVLDDASLDATERFDGIAGPSATVSMWLPPGAAGKLTVTATELASSCSVGQGTVGGAVEGQFKVELGVELTHPSPPECEVTVDRTGDGTGLVTVEPPATGAPLSCGDRCTFRARVGTSVTLHAKVLAPSYLSKWTGPCTLPTPAGMSCQLQVANGSNHVGVEFIGRSCAAGTFCNESPILKAPQHAITYIRIWGASAHELWAIDIYGIILHKVAGWWSEEVPRASQMALADIYGTGDQDLWIVGNDSFSSMGFGLHWNGQSFTSMDLPTNAQIATVWGLSPSQYFVAPRDGVMLMWDGTSWQRGTVKQPMVDIAGIWGTGGNNIWLTGIGLYQHNGFNTWLRDAAVDNLNYRGGIWGVSAADYWITGEGKQSYHRVGGVLKPAGLPEEPTGRYERITGTGASDIWASSNIGSIVHFDGTTWTVKQPASNHPLDGIWAGPDDVYATGDQNTLLHLQRTAP